MLLDLALAMVPEMKGCPGNKKEQSDQPCRNHGARVHGISLPPVFYGSKAGISGFQVVDHSPALKA
jgi:hypothetical protein